MLELALVRIERSIVRDDPAVVDRQNSLSHLVCAGREYATPVDWGGADFYVQFAHG